VWNLGAKFNGNPSNLGDAYKRMDRQDLVTYCMCSMLKARGTEYGLHSAFQRRGFCEKFDVFISGVLLNVKFEAATP